MGGGLIVAIGAQNAFVLTQAVRRNHTLVIMLLCCLCDMVFISLGVTGVGAAVAANPTLASVAGWSLRATVLALLVVTLFNPHFYLDTIVLLGSVSGQFPGEARYMFGAGAIAASCVWFASLSLGGRALAPVFAKPVAWRVLDGLVCCVMWYLAASLVRSGLA